jgi:hypothetical protein
MAVHRIANLMTSPAKTPSPASVRLGGFMACPVLLELAPWQQQLYQRAYAEAQAVVRPSIMARLQLFLDN